MTINTPKNPYHPTNSYWWIVYFFINICSYAKPKPFIISEMSINKIPKICKLVLEEVELSEFMKPLIPTIINPKIESEHPSQCLLKIYIFIKILENITVVIRFPPCNILKVDPVIKFRAIYCKTDKLTSQIDGMIK
jgi:hypothetical protein